MAKSRFDPEAFESTTITDAGATDSLPLGAVVYDGDLDELFDRAFINVPEWKNFHEVISDIYDFAQTKGFVTRNQYETVRKAAGE